MFDNGNGSATNPADYSYPRTTIPWAVGTVSGSTQAVPLSNTVDDAFVESDETVELELEPAGFFGPIVEIAPPSIHVITIVDNDTRSVTVSSISGDTTESGGTATFSVVLTSEPTADVEIPLSSSDLTEGTLSVSSLTFSPANWETPQLVTVTGQDDAIVDGGITYTVVTGTITGSSDYAGIDPGDVSVVNLDDDISALSLSIAPVSISENGGTATGTVTRNDADLSSVLVVTLSSSDTTAATVPTTVTIPVGSASATFTVTGVDDAVVDGIQTASISAAATGYIGFAAGLNVTDDDVSALSLSIAPISISENGGTATGTVTRNDADLSSALVVTLSSSDTTAATVPTTVTIPVGSASATFTVTGVDDAVVDGTQTASISVAATGYIGFAAGLNVTDDDVLALALQITPTNISEGGAATGTISRNDGDLSSPLVVTLSSSDTSEATTPATVTIPANQSSTTFVVSAVADKPGGWNSNRCHHSIVHRFRWCGSIRERYECRYNIGVRVSGGCQHHRKRGNDVHGFAVDAHVVRQNLHTQR